MSIQSFSSNPGEDSRNPAKDSEQLVLELRNVGVCYRRKRGLFARKEAGYWAIEDLSLELRRGETLGVIGRNGAGKSTLLRLLAGITRPDSGEYVNHGYQATLLSLQVGFVPHLSGRENVMLSGLLLGLERNEIQSRMSDIVAFAELEDFIDEPIQTYSSGMRARLGFATAFYVNPDILLIDEVLGVGDASFLQKSKAVMHQKIASDASVVLVSHSASAIRSLCDRVIWIDRGRVRMSGSTADVVTAYEEFVKAGSAGASPPARGDGGARSSDAEPPRTSETSSRVIGPSPAVRGLHGIDSLRQEQRRRAPPVYLPPPLETGEGPPVEQAERTLAAGFPRQDSPPFSVVPPIDWQDDPQQDRTWRFRLSSWSPLRPLLQAFRATGEVRYVDAARNFALDWIEQVVNGVCGNDFVEVRMAMGLRAAALAVVLDDALRRGEVAAQEATLLFEEAQRLRDRLANPKRLIRYSNHGIFQLAGLLALVSSFPSLDEEGDLRHYSVRNLQTLYQRHFSSEGLHLEHSPAYHVAVVRQLGLLLESGWLGDSPNLTDLYRKAVEALVWLTHPDGTLARFGDTDLWTTTELLESGGEIVIHDPELEFATTGGSSGRPPANQYAVFREAGVAAFRSPWQLPPERWSYLVATAAFHSRTHKHADDLTFEWSELGRRLVVDSGKFAYSYDDPRRRYVESTRAHNTVEIDAIDTSRAPEHVFGSALRAVGEDGRGGFYCEAVVERTPLALTHRRLLLVRLGQWLVVADHVTGEAERDLIQWLHFEPSLFFSLSRRTAVARIDEEHDLVVMPVPVEGEPSSQVLHFRGQESPQLQGWISLKMNSLQPNDALGLLVRGADRWLITLLRVCRHGWTPRQGSARYSPRSGRLEVRWNLGGVEEGLDLIPRNNDLALRILE